MPAPLRLLLGRIGRLFKRRPAVVREELPNLRRETLPDGTSVLLRPIQPGDAELLSRALDELSPESRYQRFLAPMERLTPEQLEYLTQVDGVNHLALGMAVLPPGRKSPLPIAVARCVRDANDPALAEVAIVVADAWQRRGVGSLLLRSLADDAWRVGISRWKAVMLARNQAARRLLQRIGTPTSERREGAGVVEVVYELHPPEARGKTGSAAPRPPTRPQ